MENLKKYRTGKGVSQQAVADFLEITRQAYSNYENGNRAPDTETLLKLAEYFDTTVDALLRGDSPAAGSTVDPMDSFTFAMHNASRSLTEDDKQLLLNMADRLVKMQQK